MTDRIAIPRDKLGSLTKIGQGGQGVVYNAPGFRTKFTESMVFKEYKPETLQDINFDALAAMPSLVEKSMSYDDAERLISIAAWPCALVEDKGSPIGQVMPAIPDKFTIALTTARGTAPVNAEMQHLLNHQSILTARGINIDFEARYALLRAVASDLAFLHQNTICVGDISPKNLLFSLNPSTAAYFIDCDTMRVRGISALPQVETPGWEVPEGEELATIYSDAYKLGLLALRLLVGDQDVRDPKRLSARTPKLLNKLIVDALTNAPDKRPLPTAWTYILGHAIEEAQQDKLNQSGSEKIDDGATPAIPVVRSRPKPSAAAKPTIAAQTVASLPAMPMARTTSPLAGGTTPTRTGPLFAVGIAIAVVVTLVLVGVVIAIATSTSDSPGSRSARPSTSAGYNEPSTRAPSPTSTTRPQSGSAGSWGDSRPTRAPRTSTARVQTSAPPSNFIQSGEDPTGQACAREIPLGRKNLTVARGSENTSCYFAVSVGDAYATASNDPTARIEVIAAGAADCRSVPGSPRCSESQFVMDCSMRDSQKWITCTGGNRAVVYIY